MTRQNLSFIRHLHFSLNDLLTPFEISYHKDAVTLRIPESGYGIENALILII